MNPIRVRKLDHVVLRVADIEESIRFYRDALGCPEENTNKALGLYQLRAGDSMIDLVPLDSDLGTRNGYGAPEEGRNVDHFALTIESFDEAAIRAHLERFGVVPDKPARRYGADGRGLSMHVIDPDGNIVELKGPADEPAKKAV